MEKKNMMIVAIVAILLLLLAIVGGLYATGNLGGGGGNENYKVSFVDGDNVISTMDVDKNSYVKEPAAPTKDGYIFAGWYADSAFTKAFDFKNTKITSDTTIYAKFVSGDEKFTVSFDTNGGSSVASQTVNAGEKVTKPTDPTKANSIFAGWYCDAALTEAYDFNTPVLSNITLYAKWTAESGTFTVTFNSNGGSAVPSQTVKAGEKAVKPSNPTKSGFTFSGWYSDAALTTQYNFNSAVTANITLYAKWTTSGGGGYVPPSEYKITFDPNGGNFIGDTSTTISIKVASGKTISNLPEVTRPGFAFLGWQTSSGDPFTSTTEVTSSRTVYAQWSEIEIVTLPGTSDNPPAEVTTIDEKLANELVDNANGDSIVFDASFENTYSVKISKGSISALNAAMNKEGSNVNSLTFKTNDGSVTLNSAAVSSLANSTSSNITIEVIDVKDKLSGGIGSTVGNNPVFEVSIAGDNGTIDLGENGKLTITVPYDEKSIDPKNCKVYYVTDEGVIKEAYDIIIDSDAKTITFTTGHNSYYAILPTSDTDLVKHAVNSVNAWMKSAGLNELFSFSIDPSDSNKITLTINADQVFGDRNALQNMKPEAFNGLLTNFGNLVNALFGDTTISVTVNDLRSDTSANTIFDKNGINAAGLKDFILDFGYGFFEIISTMPDDGSDNYRFKTMDVTLGDSSTFNVDIVFTGTKMPSIQSFAKTIADHISMSTDDQGNTIITLEMPDALIKSAADMATNMGGSYNSIQDAFNAQEVALCIALIGNLTSEQMFGSNHEAIDRIASIITSDAGTAFVNKVLSEITSFKVYCNGNYGTDCKTQCNGHELFTITNGHIINFTPTDNTNGEFGYSELQKLVIGIANMLNPECFGTDGKDVYMTTGDFYYPDEIAGTYKVPISITLDLKDELGMSNPITLNMTVVMHIDFTSYEKPT